LCIKIGDTDDGEELGRRILIDISTMSDVISSGFQIKPRPLMPPLLFRVMEWLKVGTMYSDG
jgi:hypothetical protein